MTALSVFIRSGARVVTKWMGRRRQRTEAPVLIMIRTSSSVSKDAFEIGDRGCEGGVGDEFSSKGGDLDDDHGVTDETDHGRDGDR